MMSILVRFRKSLYFALALGAISILFFNCAQPNQISPSDISRSSVGSGKISIDVSNPPANITAGQSNSVFFTVNDSISAQFLASCSIDGGSFQTCASPVSLDSIAAGNHTLVITVQDQSDLNSTATVNFNWTVSAPTATSTSTATPTPTPSPSPSPTPAPPAAAPVYQSVESGAWQLYYSLNSAEGPSHGYINQGAAFNVVTTAGVAGTVAVYRCSTQYGYYLYYYLDKSGCSGATNLGLLGYVYTTQVAGTRPLYQEYAPNTAAHAYTLSPTASLGFIVQGVFGYVP